MKRSLIVLLLFASSATLLDIPFSAQPPFKAPPPAFTDPGRRTKLAGAFPEIDRIVGEFVTRNHIPGAAWGIVIDGEVAHVGVTGYRDLDDEVAGHAAIRSFASRR